MFVPTLLVQYKLTFRHCDSQNKRCLFIFANMNKIFYCKISGSVYTKISTLHNIYVQKKCIIKINTKYFSSFGFFCKFGNGLFSANVYTAVSILRK